MVPTSGFNSGQASGPSQASECAGFAMPTVARSFISAGTNQTGSFFSSCAGNWGLPGMLIYLPSQGQFEILGSNQNTVTYRNRTVAPGVEILEGTRFAVGIPMAPIEVVDSGDDGGGGGGSGGGGGVTEITYGDASQLSNIRGVLNNTPSRIVPVKNNILVGRGGGEAGLNWVRRQLGQMRYPVTPVRLWTVNQNVGNVAVSPVLPGKPVLPDEVESFGVELLVQVRADKTGLQGSNVGMILTAEGLQLAAAASDSRMNFDNNSAIVNLPKSATSINLAIAPYNSSGGTMQAYVTLLAYHY